MMLSRVHAMQAYKPGWYDGLSWFLQAHWLALDIY